MLLMLLVVVVVVVVVVGKKEKCSSLFQILNSAGRSPDFYCGGGLKSPRRQDQDAEGVEAAGGVDAP